MKLGVLMVVFLCLSSIELFSQSEIKAEYEMANLNPNVIYVEGFIINPEQYNFGYPSINYERYFADWAGLSFRIGVTSDFSSYAHIPISVNHLSHLSSNHHFEAGIGAITSIQEKTENSPNTVNFYSLFVPLMYRYQQKNGLVFRAGANAFFGDSYFVAPSISIGYKF